MTSITANANGKSGPAVAPMYQRIPRPEMRAPHPTIMILGGAYATAGGMTKASTTSHAPKTAEMRGKTVKKSMPAKVNPETRNSPAKTIRNEPALGGAHVRRSTADQHHAGPSLDKVLMHP